MKNLLILSSVSSLLLFSSLLKVKDKTPIQTYKAYALNNKGVKIDSAEVDLNNQYSFSNLKPGLYDILIVKPGFKPYTIFGLEHLSKNIKYKNSVQLIQNETSTIHSNREAIEETPKSGTAIITKSLSARHEKDGIVRATEISEPMYSGEDEIGVRAESLGESKSLEHTRGSDTRMGKLPSAGPAIKSGQITAGIWNDLENWEKWENTIAVPEIAKHLNEWNMYTNNRFSIKVTDKNNNPVIGLKVQLFENGDKLEFTAITDNKGETELWAMLNTQIATKEVKKFKVKMTAKERVFEFDVKPSSVRLELALPLETATNPIADVAFVVDATGSMGDEIDYLQAELLDVITRVKKQNTCIDLNIGSVFYRDNGDEYVTRKSEFSNDLTQTINFIFDQKAGGGGDFPEAVDAALENAVNNLNWREGAMSKIIFLVLDAPPHSDEASVKRMNNITKIAASKGIKIIPVMASGINQSTEFLMKSMAIATNGKYIYITDHSGIGGTHQKPTGVKENVHYLNDLMVETISENLVWAGCKETNDSSLWQNINGTVEIKSEGQWQVQFYPNPAINEIMVKSSELCDAILIYDFAGKEVKSNLQITDKKTTLDVRMLPTGVYFIKCKKGTQQISCRMLIMK